MRNARITALASLVAGGLASAGAAFAQAASDLKPTLVPAPVDRIFVPLGFDDNDNVEVVLSGHFTNACSKVGPVRVDVDAARKVVTLTPQSFLYDRTGRCAAQEMFVPFTQTVTLGNLDVGDYRVRLADQPDLAVEALKVGKSTKATPDEFLYAPVEEVLVRQSPSLGGALKRITLRGTFPVIADGCLSLKEVRTSVTPGNVVVVQPIVETLAAGDCAARSISREFTFRKNLSDPLSGMALVHVRVMNGQSLNRVVTIDP